MSNTAKETLAYCTSCKMDLSHIIVAMKGDKIVKAQCKTCDKTHAYKAPKGITEPGQAKKSKKAQAAEKAQAASVESEWEKLMSTHKDAPTKPYGMKAKFKLGDKVSHTNFGDGIVNKLIYPNKVEVIFRQDIKVLIHGGI